MIYVVAHGDLDGMTSAAVLSMIFRRLGIKSNVIFTQPYSLDLAMDRVLRICKLKRLTTIFVLDVGLNEDMWRRIYEVLEELVRLTTMIWIDHHITTVGFQKELGRLGIISCISIRDSTSGIVRKLFHPLIKDDKFLEKLLLVGEVDDMIKSVDDEEFMRLVTNLSMALSYEEMREEFRMRLMRLWMDQGVLMDEGVEERALKGMRELEELTRLALNNSTFQSENALVVDLRTGDVRGYVGKVASTLCEKLDKAIFIAFLPSRSSNEVVVTCRSPPESSINAYELLMNLANELGGLGGGHMRAISVRIPKVHADIFLDRLGDELRNMDLISHS